ncbi:Serine/threonine protein phosphatase 7 long form isogeny [Arachis hypogaea]|nr:Serine/threonine protein phosphatase 7 long form isogeny [Arachis hypogaea]
MFLLIFAGYSNIMTLTNARDRGINHLNATWHIVRAIIFKFKDFVFDNSLIIAFVEQWRLETHNFHLSWGECTITLQEEWVEELLGDRPPHAKQQDAYQMAATVGRLPEVSSYVLGIHYACMDVFLMVSTRETSPYVFSGCESKDQYEQRVLRWRGALDRLQLHGFLWTSYEDLARQVKWQFSGEQPVPGDPVNVTRFLMTIGQGEDVWWPTRHEQWSTGTGTSMLATLDICYN